MIPVARPAISDSELSRVAEVFQSRWLGQGAVTSEFGRAISERLGGRPFLPVNTGTTAIHLALAAIGIGAGDDVVLPSLTFVAAAQAVVLAGARPVLCDVNPATLNVDVECLERAVTPRTRAVLPVHYRGLPVDLQEILAWAAERDIRVVEDAAHAFGSVYPDGTLVGAIGDVTCFSFDPIKNITTGEGGGIAFAREDERERAAKMSALGIDSTAWGRLETKRPWAYDVLDNGFRYHMPNFCAAIGLAQLERFAEFRQRKQWVVDRYQQAFRDLPHLEMPEMPVDRCCPFLALVLVDDRESFMSQLKARGVGTGVHYIPTHQFSRFRDAAAGQLNVTDMLGERICSLPLMSDETDEECEQVVEAVLSSAPEASAVG
jgi:perosamine synthetase